MYIDYTCKSTFSRFAQTKRLNPRLKASRVCMHTIYIYIDTAGTSFHIFQSQDYVVAGRTESHQSVCVVAMN